MRTVEATEQPESRRKRRASGDKNARAEVVCKGKDEARIQSHFGFSLTFASGQPQVLKRLRPRGAAGDHEVHVVHRRPLASADKLKWKALPDMPLGARSKQYFTEVLWGIQGWSIHDY